MAKIAILAETMRKTQAIVSYAQEQLKEHELTIPSFESRLSNIEIANIISKQDAIVVGREAIDSDMLKNSNQLKAIAKYGVGLDKIDIETCKKLGIRLYLQDGMNADCVAEFAVGLMLSLTRRISFSDNQMRQGIWNKDGGFLLTGKTVGIVGCGHIGSRVAKILRSSFQCQVLINDCLDKKEFAQKIGAKQVGLEELFIAADFVSLHIPLNNETRKLIGPALLGKMPSSSCLINTSRGEVIDQKALKGALQSRKIRGAALDVYEEEPLMDAELAALPNLICTPHIAGSAQETIRKLSVYAIDSIRDFFTSENAQ
ncbi:MAG: phosphoglycerate dehydrogenase [Oligoflexales bacterium]|nr:phosphoglycerate dehydrogenase [Oligoflexales bacterium]